jgi:amino acid permease
VPTVLFPLVAALTHITCRMLGECRRLCGHSNYSSLGRETYNNRLFILFIFFCFVLNNTGICIAESQIFGSSIVDILILQGLYQPNAFYTQRWFVSLLLLLLIPIVLLKKIQSLKYFTVIGITAISTFLIMVFVDLAFTNQARGYSPSNTFYAFNPTFNFFKAFSTVPNVLLAFTYQINFFPIFKGLRRPSL